MTESRIIVSLDYPDMTPALELAARLDPGRCRVKIGKELFTRHGPLVVERIQNAGFEVFLDLKFHDIPNTVAGACSSAASLGVWMLNVHASGGHRMIAAARDALECTSRRPLLIAVTILTSLGAGDLEEIGMVPDPASQVERLAGLAAAAGADGVVCSAMEAESLRRQRGPGFVLVTPGIRPSGASRDDQQRILTPAEAIMAGSDYLVIGRPITQADDPLAVLERIEAEINTARMSVSHKV